MELERDSLVSPIEEVPVIGGRCSPRFASSRVVVWGARRLPAPWAWRAIPCGDI
jgi:hypothetical protein